MALFDSSEDMGQNARKIEGIVLGVVTNNQDREGLGRVKVSFPWAGDDDESRWARISSFMAGKKRGSFFLPEVGDEVIVAFDHGDINYPYILGAVWNDEGGPPASNDDGKNNIRMLKSRSGHEIVFNDDQDGGKERIEIRTRSGHIILLDDATGQEKIEIKDKTGNNSISIDSVKNSMEISSQAKLSIKAKNIEIEASGMMSIKSGVSMSIQSTIVKIN